MWTIAVVPCKRIGFMFARTGDRIPPWHILNRTEDEGWTNFLSENIFTLPWGHSVPYRCLLYSQNIPKMHFSFPSPIIHTHVQDVYL